MEEAEIVEKPKFAIVWFLPAIAFLIGIAMVFNHWLNQGHQIKIYFNTAEGLEVNKTKVKFKNVDIGLVNSIEFNEDASKVVLEVEIKKELGGFLREDSQFWVVRPRVGVGGVSGIGTLLSGSYIELSPGKKENLATTFTGLEAPPVTPLNTAGIQLKLVSSESWGVSIGDSVTYNGLTVGRVETFRFNPEKREAEYTIFIKAPYDSLVTNNTVFWNSSGFSLTTDTDGLRLNIASVENMVSGGVSFDVLDGVLGEPVRSGDSFALYKDKYEAKNRRKYEYIEYVVLSESAVDGLKDGAPVEYRGLQVGVVAQSALNYDKTFEIREKYGLQNDGRIVILVRLEPGRFTNSYKGNMEYFREYFDNWIKRGVKASLATASLLSGSLKISLDISPKKEKEVGYFGPYPIIPVGTEGLSGQVSEVLAKINKIPIEQTFSELQLVLKGLQPNSGAYKALEVSMEKLQKTLDDIQPFLKTVGNNPSSLIFGRSNSVDTEPKAKGE